jgi:hypothetical protein
MRDSKFILCFAFLSSVIAIGLICYLALSYSSSKPKILSVVPLNPTPVELQIKSELKTDNSEIVVQKLFTDAYGCTILRFQDDEGWHYYALGPVEPKGKDLIQTLKRQ